MVTLSLSVARVSDVVAQIDHFLSTLVLDHYRHKPGSCSHSPRNLPLSMNPNHGSPNAIAGFLNENNTVELEWAPGYQDIPGNDRDDGLAKARVEMASLVTGMRAAGLRKAKGRVITT